MLPVCLGVRSGNETQLYEIDFDQVCSYNVTWSLFHRLQHLSRSNGFFQYSPTIMCFNLHRPQVLVPVPVPMHDGSDCAVRPADSPRLPEGSPRQVYQECWLGKLPPSLPPPSLSPCLCRCTKYPWCSTFSFTTRLNNKCLILYGWR